MLGCLRRASRGASARQLQDHLGVSRSTVLRRLHRHVRDGSIQVWGIGQRTRYHAAPPLNEVLSYLERPARERRLAPFRPELLNPLPNLSDESVRQFEHLPAFAFGPRQREAFEIEFACASASLEGGSYSPLDCQALFLYGEMAVGKPLKDAYLVLNHRDALQRLMAQRSGGSIYQIHEDLTNDHELAELRSESHFLPRASRGGVRENVEVWIGGSTYVPPFAPGNGLLQRLLERLLLISKRIQNPLRASFYLLSRIAYLQPFADGNRRTARTICNLPLMDAHLPPITFAGMRMHDYLVGTLAFYELGDSRLLERCFTNAYAHSAKKWLRTAT